MRLAGKGARGKAAGLAPPQHTVARSARSAPESSGRGGEINWSSSMSRTGATFQVVGMAIATLITRSLLLGQDPAWMNLGHIDRGNTYSVILRNGACLRGTIRSVSADMLSLAVPNLTSKNRADVFTAPRLVTVARLDALQVKDGLHQFDILYSGRSSWRDVEAAPSHSREYLSIRLKSGESVRGEPVGSTDSQLSVKRSNGVMHIAKRTLVWSTTSE